MKKLALNPKETLVIIQALDTYIRVYETCPAEGYEETQKSVMETAKNLKAEFTEQLIEAGYNLWTDEEDKP